MMSCCKRQTAPDSARADEPLFPRHAERPLAARAAHGVRRSFELRAVAAAGAHGVLVTPQCRQAARVARDRDDGPVVRRRRDDLERSEEHTSELQSRSDLVCRLLLEKKKKTNTVNNTVI